ncbi:uncharacterized protein LOC128546178 isoform X2 [Mercenaria mercenaria]|uniref:uncharacterized protein LOC128546178 isoform X2 n=1 Tax=Mercenaria mercenaria TaxID=6596 RepID=UPI00234ED4B3|nr:uncharacterized protein LOC128546178 isoform X2 [Mercenaria mercenaria]
MALLELLYKYCELQCPNAKTGCNYIFVGKDKTEYWEHVNKCHCNEILQVKQERKVEAPHKTHVYLYNRTNDEGYNGNRNYNIDTGSKQGRAESIIEKHPHKFCHGESDSTVKQDPSDRFRSRSMSGSRCRSENQVKPVLTNDNVYSPMPERSTNGWQRPTTDRRRHSSKRDSFPVHGYEPYEKSSHSNDSKYVSDDGHHLSRYRASDGKVTSDIAGIIRTVTPRPEVTPNVRALFSFKCTDV